MPIAHNSNAISSTPEINISISTHENSVNQSEYLLTENATIISEKPNTFFYWQEFNDRLKKRCENRNLISDRSNTCVQNDGDIILTNSHTPRNEKPTLNRGWRAMFRVSLQKNAEFPMDPYVRQQYVTIPYRSKGW